jgi:hypothetical protein
MILFLDFDGVTHAVSASDTDEGVFSRVHLLWEILRDHPEVQVVFSTSWREIYAQDELVNFATANGGEDLVPRFIGQAPRHRSEEGSYMAGPIHVRETECRFWLIGNGFAKSSWIALDDDATGFSPECTNLILANPKTGLDESNISELRRRLVNQNANGIVNTL